MGFTRKTFGFTRKTIGFTRKTLDFTRKTFDFTRKTFNFTRKTMIYDTNGLCTFFDSKANVNNIFYDVEEVSCIKMC